MQDETANQILQCLTAAAQNRSPTHDMPSLSLRVSMLSTMFFYSMLLRYLLCTLTCELAFQHVLHEISTSCVCSGLDNMPG